MAIASIMAIRKGVFSSCGYRLVLPSWFCRAETCLFTQCEKTVHYRLRVVHLFFSYVAKYDKINQLSNLSSDMSRDKMRAIDKEL